RQGFYMKKDRIMRENVIIRWRTYLCNYSGSYSSKSKKDTSTKKTKCQFLINALCPKLKNPNSEIQINKIVNEHNHLLSVEMIDFKEKKKFFLK
ncbi:18732_t:CDS:1, partial [Gigaspora rosea]